MKNGKLSMKEFKFLSDYDGYGRYGGDGPLVCEYPGGAYKGDWWITNNHAAFAVREEHLPKSKPALESERPKPSLDRIIPAKDEKLVRAYVGALNKERYLVHVHMMIRKFKSIGLVVPFVAELERGTRVVVYVDEVYLNFAWGLCGVDAPSNKVAFYIRKKNPKFILVWSDYGTTPRWIGAIATIKVSLQADWFFKRMYPAFKTCGERR